MEWLLARCANPTVRYFITYKTAKITGVVFKAYCALPGVLKRLALGYTAGGAGFGGITGGR